MCMCIKLHGFVSQTFCGLWITGDLLTCVRLVYFLWWFDLDRSPNSSRWFEWHDVVHGLVSVVLQVFCCSVLLDRTESLALK